RMMNGGHHRHSDIRESHGDDDDDDDDFINPGSPMMPLDDSDDEELSLDTRSPPPRTSPHTSPTSTDGLVSPAPGATSPNPEVGPGMTELVAPLPPSSISPHPCSTSPHLTISRSASPPQSSPLSLIKPITSDALSTSDASCITSSSSPLSDFTKPLLVPSMSSFPLMTSLAASPLSSLSSLPFSSMAATEGFKYPSHPFLHHPHPLLHPFSLHHHFPLVNPHSHPFFSSLSSNSHSAT
ncbi:unnamed protein product, partial [Meganyctiphanes norvegica]